MRTTPRPLWSGFLDSATRFAAAPALNVAGAQHSYQEVCREALEIAATVQAFPELSPEGLTAVFAYRSREAFAGILGVLLGGNGYVPLNPTFPEVRTRLMFESSGCRAIVVDEGCLPQLEAVLVGADAPVLILLPGVEDVSVARERFREHLVLGSADLTSASAWREPEGDQARIAYLLFTSGSTGAPKGVMVTHGNARAFLDHVVGRFEITRHDRLSQLFDLTFDLSVFDMFAAWEQGACLCCPGQKALVNPARFVRENELTVWFSVPSTAIFMKRLGALKPGAFPSLRWSLFCGEPLPVAIAEAWSEAAPNATLENLYGPTELTIACAEYRWAGSESLAEAENGIVPIGEPFPGMDSLVVDDGLAEVAPGVEGELVMRGPQMSLGYWKDPAKTAASFVVPPGRAEVYYRTGDRVRRPVGSAPLKYLGRMDSQIKIRGYRVELGEIEATVRSVVELDGVVAIPWPVTENGCEGVEVFVQGDARDVEPIRTAVSSRLPEYMVPQRFHFLDEFPLNVNGKFDRKALAARLGELR
jgi:amino acid adenylation domain-containing protein